MRVLVIGANGQLGSACCASLRARGHAVRGPVRRLERGRPLAELGVEVVQADLASADQVRSLVSDVDAIIVTANSAAPRRGDRAADLDNALTRVLATAAGTGVGRVVLPSVPLTPFDDRIPLFRAKRRLEETLATSTMSSAVLRLPPFMESWLALVGSSVPLRGEPHATLGRSSPFLRRFRAATATLVEDRGILLAPGRADTRSAFISVHDVADACSAAVEGDRHDDGEDPGSDHAVVDVAGPEVLTWRDVADVFARLLDRRVRVLATPAPVFAALAAVMKPFGDAPSGTMALNRAMAATETPWTDPGGGLVDPLTMTTVTQFLEAKLRLPAALPEVA